MALYKIKDRCPNYPDVYFGGHDPKGLTVYSAESHKMGVVRDLLIDDSNQLKYLIVGFDPHNNFLLPIDRCSQFSDTDRIYVKTLNRHEFEYLPKYDERDLVEEGQPLQEYYTTPVEQSASVEMNTLVEEIVPLPAEMAAESDLSQQTSLQKDESIQLFEERLVTQVQRVKTGEVKISKQIVTETTQAKIPVTKEKIVIEIESVYGGETRLDIGEAQVAEDGSVYMGIYEEQPVVCRRVVPYQNVSVRKEIVKDTVITDEVLRREELDVQVEGDPSTNWSDSGVSQ